MNIINAMFMLFCIIVISVMTISIAIMARLSILFKQTYMRDKFIYIGNMLINIGDEIMEYNEVQFQALSK